MGAEAAKAVQVMLESSSHRRAGVLAAVIGFATLIVGATGVLIELQDALNTVWKVAPKPGRGIKGIARDRLLSFGIVLSFGFLLLVSLVLSAAVALLDSWVGSLIPGWVAVGYVLSYGLSLGLVAFVLAAIFKILPDAKIAWRDVWVGAVVTSVLFHLGKFGISLYISKASVASTFGAAGWCCWFGSITHRRSCSTALNSRGSTPTSTGPASSRATTPCRFPRRLWPAWRWRRSSSAARSRPRPPKSLHRRVIERSDETT